MGQELHFDHPSRRQPMLDPRPESRVDDHAARVHNAVLARQIASEERLSGTTTESHRYFPVDGVALVVRRDVFGRLSIQSEPTVPGAPIIWSSPNAGALPGDAA